MNEPAPAAPAATGWRHALTVAIAAFLLSRVIVFAAVLLPTLLHEDAVRYSPQDRVLLAWSSADVHATLTRLSRSNDAGWYREIALHGYSEDAVTQTQQANWAFFPLQPLLLRGAIGVFGDGPLVPILLAHTWLFIALVLLHRLVCETGRSVATADRAVWALALFPVSHFLSFPWTESLFLALTIGSVLAAQRSAWGWVGVLGACASATRLPGVFLLPALLVHRRAPSRRAWLGLAAIPLGLVAFMAWLWASTGDPLAFGTVQAAWGREFGLPLRDIGIALLRPWEIAADWNVRALNLGALALGALATLHFVRRREWTFALLLGLGLLAPLLSGNITSMARYLLGLFPVAIALADWGETRPVAERAWFALAVAMLVLMSAAFGLGVSFAGT